MKVLHDLAHYVIGLGITLITVAIIFSIYHPSSIWELLGTFVIALIVFIPMDKLLHKVFKLR